MNPIINSSAKIMAINCPAHSKVIMMIEKAPSNKKIGLAAINKNAMMGKNIMVKSTSNMAISF